MHLRLSVVYLERGVVLVMDRSWFTYLNVVVEYYFWLLDAILLVILSFDYHLRLWKVILVVGVPWRRVSVLLLVQEVIPFYADRVPFLKVDDASWDYYFWLWNDSILLLFVIIWLFVNATAGKWARHVRLHPVARLIMLDLLVLLSLVNSYDLVLIGPLIFKEAFGL